MRTLSDKPTKGHEPPRRWVDNWRLLVTILKMGCDYLVRGSRVRRKFYALRRAGEKYYVDEL